MNFLAICQRVRQECDVTGTGPTTVVAQTGLLKRIVDWAASSYDEIQSKHVSPGWRWMRVGFTVNTGLGDDNYASTECTDALTAAPIARFRRWWPFNEEGRQNFKIYLQSAGVGTERWIPYVPWSSFRSIYKIGTQNNGPPAFVTVDPQNNIVLGPPPDGVYVLSGEFQRGNQALAADSDTPDMPANFHMLIVYWAMTKYGQFKAATEVFNRGVMEGNRLMRQLELDQLPPMGLGTPLA